jgi:hypothetical protein
LTQESSPKTEALPIQKLTVKIVSRLIQKSIVKIVSLPIRKSTTKSCVAADLEIGSQKLW